MDGLRLALIVAGVVVVAAVWWWSARRRRMDREAGEFNRFEAWSDESLDPLAAPDEAPPAAGRLPNGGAGGGAGDGAGSGLRGRGVLEGLEAIASSLDTRSEPRLGDVGGLEPPAPPRRAAAPERPPEPPRPEPPREPRRDASRQPSRPAPRPAPKAPSKHARPGATPRGAARGEPPPATPAEAEMVVVLNVMAPVGKTFDGPPLKAALEDAGLRPGEMQLYHYRSEAHPAPAPPIFSALNVVKPGTLTPQGFEGMRTPGVALVLRLPGPERPAEAFELMHGTATRIAESLGGRLCDETRSTLTRQALNHLRERIADLARRRRA